MGITEGGTQPVFEDSSLTSGPKPEHSLDLFTYWSVLRGQPRPLDNQLRSEAARRISEAERLFPTIEDEKRQAENNENKALRTAELTMFVLETCAVAPSRHYFREAWGRITAHSQIDQVLISGEPVQLDAMGPQAIKALSDDIEELEVMIYLYEAIVQKVTQASRLQNIYGYSEKQAVRRLTSRFTNRSKVEGEIDVAERYEKFIPPTPCLKQLAMLENKVISTATRKKVEVVLRILIAEQGGIKLPNPPVQLSSVE